MFIEIMNDVARDKLEVHSLGDSVSSSSSWNSSTHGHITLQEPHSPPSSTSLDVKNSCSCDDAKSPSKERWNLDDVGSPIAKANVELQCASPDQAGIRCPSPERQSQPPQLKMRNRRGILRSRSRRALRASQSSGENESTRSSRSHSSSSSSPGTLHDRSSHYRTTPRYISRIRKHVSFDLPDDVSVATSTSGSLLLCDVAFSDDHDDDEDDINNRGCHIVLPFMNGLDSDDDDDLDVDGSLRAGEIWDSKDERKIQFDSDDCDDSSSSNLSSVENDDNVEIGFQSQPPTLTPLKTDGGRNSEIEQFCSNESPNCVMAVPHAGIEAASMAPDFGFANNGDLLLVQECTTKRILIPDRSLLLFEGELTLT